MLRKRITWLFLSVVAFVFVMGLSEYTYAAKGMRLDQHDTDIKADIATHDENMAAEHEGLAGDIDEHDAEVKAGIVAHDENMTIEHGVLSTEHGDLDAKLNLILGGGGGACADAPVEKTGQTSLFATGGDGNLQRGVAWPNPRFTDNGDGTVTDNLTGLIWMKNAKYFVAQDWSAVNSCNLLTNGQAGLTDGSGIGDWRLPNVKELQSLVHYGFYDPALPDTLGTSKWSSGDPFTDVQLSWYWSSTTFADNTSRAWYVSFLNGDVNHSTKPYNGGHVWCVRGGP